MRLFFTGMMASGKSFWAKKIAQHINYLFFDLDNYIEEKEQKTIAEIFEQKGEDYFRQLEHLCLKEIISLNDNFILACGGGTPCFYDNAKIMKQVGKVIYLECSMDELVNRINCENNKRPLLKSVTEKDLKMYLTDKLNERIFFYSQHHLIIHTDQINETKFIEKINSLIQ